MIAKIKSLAVIGGIHGFTAGLVFLGKGHLDPFVPGLTVLGTTAALAAGVQALAFIPAYIYQTEKFFDLTGSLTFLLCTGYSFYAGSVMNNGIATNPAKILSVLAAIWALRLGSFLFNRILRDGKDGRFDEIKPNPLRFLTVWTIQGLWVFLTAFPVFIINSSQGLTGGALSPLGYFGLATWAVGFSLEAIADYQKRVWKNDPNKKNPFIDVGLWKYSRHPNYFGEITLWTGTYLTSVTSFAGTQHIGALSPIFVFLLLNYVSGIPLLESGADKKFAGNEEYLKYKKNTSILVPLLPRKSNEKDN